LSAQHLLLFWPPMRDFFPSQQSLLESRNMQHLFLARMPEGQEVARLLRLQWLQHLR
jgi:hypothetical protein